MSKYLGHRNIENKALTFALLTTVLISIGGLVELVPLAAVRANVPDIASVRPYTPLELEGRDLYIREGCYNCHSQMIRPFRAETLRYGRGNKPAEYSRAGEFVYDHPFQWGSKRTGPDLHRVGGKYNDAWHYLHMEDPAETSPGSIMPRYPWLLTRQLKGNLTQRKMRAMVALGVPYTEQEVERADELRDRQAAEIAARLAESKIECEPDREIIAMIAYLQRLGTDLSRNPGGAP